MKMSDEPPGNIADFLAASKKKKQPLAVSEDIAASGLITERRDVVRHVALWNAWLEWDGTVWLKDQTLSFLTQARTYCRGVKGADNLKTGFVASVEQMSRWDARAAARTEQWNADLGGINAKGVITSKENMK